MPSSVETRHKKLIEDSQRLFKRESLDSYWQEVAFHFYPEMAEFTTTRYLGEEYADHLSTSYPLIARRTLGDSLSALLRPVNLDTTSPGIWFAVRAEDERREDIPAQKWLEFATKVQRSAMYDRQSGFVRATKQGDHSFATFGQCPITVELSPDRSRLLYRCWHLRDVAWTEGADNQINAVYRRWSPTVSQLLRTFGKNTSPQLKEKVKDTPYKTVSCLHVVIQSADYEERTADGKKYRLPWVSVWIDLDHQYVMEEIESRSKIYVIPRWVTVPGTQYASSPAVMAALPDARLIQAITATILESGEKFADPPMVATQEAIKSDVNLLPGGVTYVDAEYDEKLGEALRPLYEANAGSGLSSAFQMRGDVRDMIAKAFFLDSLSLPPADTREMTAFEVGQRISEWIRRAMPIFEPMEFEYNGALCEETFDLLLHNGAFGSFDDLPQNLRDADIKFKFESPLHESADRKKGQKFLEAVAALDAASRLDPAVISMLNATDTLRDVLKGIGVPPTWQRSDGEMDDIRRAQEQLEQQQAGIEGADAGSQIAKNLGSAAKDFAQASVV